MTMKVLICGGAGYIGSHLVREIQRSCPAWQLVVLDNLSAGHREAVPESTVAFEQGDVRDVAFLDAVFERHKPTAVVHMCASIIVPESMRDPLMYYDNNVVGALRIVQTMVKHNCKYIVFSSTAALFGTPDHSPIKPQDTIRPESVYGETKWITEMMLRACDAAYGVKYVSLRYFNACGADQDGDIGECHQPESHLIPIILQVPLGQRPHVTVFGTDYETYDGTCVRDYVHTSDVASAHINAIEYLTNGGQSDQFNLGNGAGYSVRQVIEAARRVTGHAIPVVEAPRRPGDPSSLVADSSRALEVLHWKPRYSSLDDIIASAWRFHQHHPKGF